MPLPVSISTGQSPLIKGLGAVLTCGASVAGPQGAKLWGCNSHPAEPWRRDCWPDKYKRQGHHPNPMHLKDGHQAKEDYSRYKNLMKFALLFGIKSSPFPFWNAYVSPMAFPSLYFGSTWLVWFHKFTERNFSLGWIISRVSCISDLILSRWDFGVIKDWSWGELRFGGSKNKEIRFGGPKNKEIRFGGSLVSNECILCVRRKLRELSKKAAVLQSRMRDLTRRGNLLPNCLVTCS